jgi:hypothetical protein
LPPWWEPCSRSLAVARDLSEAADLEAWLSNVELSHLPGLAHSTVSGWSTGQSAIPGFELERRKYGDSVRWKVARL